MICSVKELSKTLQRDHIAIAKNCFDDLTIKKLKSEASDALENCGSTYAFGNAIRLYGRNHKYKTIKNIFLSKDFQSIAKSYYSCDHKFESVFLTHEYKSNKMAPNGYLHADKAHALKFMIYLNDVDLDSGPFTYIPNSKADGIKLRMSGKNNQLRNHVGLQHIAKRATPVLGPAGTLIIFSTDIVHMGGLTNGGERFIARSHWRP